ncbi:MAG: hypothetical protein ACYSVY_11205 [Planctomycetota bacterium]
MNLKQLAKASHGRDSLRFAPCERSQRWRLGDVIGVDLSPVGKPRAELYRVACPDASWRRLHKCGYGGSLVTSGSIVEQRYVAGRARPGVRIDQVHNWTEIHGRQIRSYVAKKGPHWLGDPLVVGAHFFKLRMRRNPECAPQPYRYDDVRVQQGGSQDSE